MTGFTKSVGLLWRFFSAKNLGRDIRVYVLYLIADMNYYT